MTDNEKLHGEDHEQTAETHRQLAQPDAEVQREGLASRTQDRVAEPPRAAQALNGVCTSADLKAMRDRDAASGATWFTGPASFTAQGARDRRLLLAEVDRLANALDGLIGLFQLIANRCPQDVMADVQDNHRWHEAHAASYAFRAGVAPEVHVQGVSRCPTCRGSGTVYDTTRGPDGGPETCPACLGEGDGPEVHAIFNDQRQGTDSPYVASTDPSADQGNRKPTCVTTPGRSLQEATETPIAQSAPATISEVHSMSSLKIGATARGFALVDFEDGNGVKCSLQKSSAAERDMIWLGCDEPNPRHCPGDGTGWHPVTLPPDTLCDTRMHLTREQVAALLPLLHTFVDTGELPSPFNDSEAK